MTAQFCMLNNGGKMEFWYKDGNYHRINGPAVTRWNDNGFITMEYWYAYGKLVLRKSLVT